MLFPSSLIYSSGIYIPLEDRVLNISSGYCGYCCLETVGRYHRLPKLYNLVSKTLNSTNNGATNDKERKKILDDLSISYISSLVDSYNTNIIEECLAKSLPIIVAFKPKVNERFGHVVILLSYSTKEVSILDPNKVDKISKLSLSSFKSKWTGSTLVITSTNRIDRAVKNTSTSSNTTEKASSTNTNTNTSNKSANTTKTNTKLSDLESNNKFSITIIRRSNE